MNLQSPIKEMKAARRKAMVSWMICFVLAAGLFARAQSTNDSSSTDYSDFQVIVQRNIFDPNRYPRTSSYRPPRERGAPTFSLAGTMSYRKGMYAFFSGTSSEYQKALQQGGTIAGYTVAKIDFEGVQLQNAGKQVHMTVGSAMRQEGDGWVLSLPGEWSGTTVTDSASQGSGDTNQSASETSTASLPSGGPTSDVLKRLIEQRQQQEQQK
jgi:hypothetical protein